MMAEFAIGTQYDIAKRALESGAIKPVTKPQSIREFANVGAWFATDMDFKYFMLLCREAYDFTVFNMVTTNHHKAQQELQEVLESRGQVVFIEYNHDSECYEFWVKCNDTLKAVTHESYVMYRLFPCNEWVVEV